MLAPPTSPALRWVWPRASRANAASCCGRGSRGRTCRRPLRCAGSSRATKVSPTSPLAAPRLRLADDAHSVHAEPSGLEPGRTYWYRFEALGQRSASGRTRTAPAADAAAGLRFALASCQRFDHGHYAAWRHVAGSDLDFVLFVGDYIYEYPSPPVAVRFHEGGAVRTLEQYRARYAQYKSDPSLQAAHAAMPWLAGVGRPRGRQRLRRPARPGPAGRLSRAARRGVSRLLGAHAVSEGAAARRCRHAHLRPLPTGDRWSASTRSTIANTATRRHARSPAAAAPTPCACATAPSCSTRSARCSVPRRSAGWPTAGIRDAAGTCSRSRP